MNKCEEVSDFTLFLGLAFVAAIGFILLMELNKKIQMPIDCKTLKSEIELCNKLHSTEYCENIYSEASCEGDS